VRFVSDRDRHSDSRPARPPGPVRVESTVTSNSSDRPVSWNSHDINSAGSSRTDGVCDCQVKAASVGSHSMARLVVAHFTRYITTISLIKY
jgi:hypothetical protein